MPRDGNNLYFPPSGTSGTPLTPINSAAYNGFVADISADQNNPRPVIAGGTGAATATNARTNLGLGNAATRSVGTTAGTVAAGDDSRITGALQKAGGIMSGDIDMDGNAILNTVAATFQEFNKAEPDKLLKAESVWGSTVALTDAGTIAVNLDGGYDFKCTVTGNRTLGAATNIREGKKGAIHFKATGVTRTLTLHSSYKLYDGIPAGPYEIATTEKLLIAYLCEDGVVEITGVMRRTL